MNVLLDSDILIEILRMRDEAILIQWSTLVGSDAVILFSPVSAAEVWAGARPKEQDAIAACFENLLCAAIDYETGRLAGDLLLQYHKSHSLEIADALIAATALRNNAALWTRNRKHYPMQQLTFFTA